MKRFISQALARRCRWAGALLLAWGQLAAFAQGGWLPGFQGAGLNGEVTAVLTQPNGDVVAGGAFTNAGGHPAADHVARWDGRAWQPLGEGPGRFDSFAALQRLPNGHLLAAGTVYDSASSLHSVVTRWDGRRWQPLGSIPSGISANALAVQADGGVLVGCAGNYAGRQGPHHNVLRWDGRTWQPLAANPPANPTTAGNNGRRPDCYIRELVVTPAGELIAAGFFPDFPTEVARWAGTAWQPLGPPGQRRTANLTLTPDGEVLASGTLYDYDAKSSVTTTTNYVARWDGHAWQPLGEGPTGWVERLAVGPSGEVLATTSIHPSEPDDTRRTAIERWDGTRWQALDPAPPAVGRSPARQAFAVAADGAVIGSDPLGLARWDGRAWQPMAGKPAAGFADARRRRVRALAVAPGGQVFVASYVYDAIAPQPDASGNATGQPDAYRLRTQVHRWDGRRRYALRADFEGVVAALAVARNGDVLAAGDFALANGPDTIRYLARWDGRRWQPLGTPLPAAPQALAVAPNGDVLAGGAFGLTRWDGRHWQPQLPNRPESSGWGADPAYVSALAVAPNGDILAGGRFAGPDPRHDVPVVRWDGRQWLPLDAYTEPFVASLAADRTGAVIVGTGSSGTAHGDQYFDSGTVVRSDTAGLMGWDTYPPTQFRGYVRAVAVAANGDIIAGGGFQEMNDGTFVSYLARRHRGTWQAVGGSGLNGEVRALAVAPNGDLVVGGDFTATGDGTQSLGLWGIYRDR